MFLSLLFLFAITVGGLGLTYLIENKRTFMWRVAAGNVAGSALFGVVCFFLSLVTGLNLVSIAVAALLVLAFVLLVKTAKVRPVFRHDWDKAKGRIERFTFSRVQSLTYYAFFVILFAAFFDRAMIVTVDGIFTGASNNLGDLPFHLGAIYGFTDGNNFPPQNPSFAGAKFTYPFIADFVAAVYVKLGLSPRWAMLMQNVTWAFSLVVIFERFAAAVTSSRLAGKIAPFILFLTGGLGFVWFFKDYWQGAAGFFDLLWNLPKDYTINDQFRWGNSMVVLFITQRSLLLGMPLTIIVLHFLWDLFVGKREDLGMSGILPAFVMGLLAGTLPLIHAHSLLVLFVVSGFLCLSSFRYWKSWIAFAAGTSIVGGALLFWMLTGSATGTSEFLAWHFGFDSRGTNIFWFWLINTGIFIPISIGGIALMMLAKNRDEEGEEGASNGLSIEHLIFVLPFILIFIVSNFAKFAPWEWDNIKLLIYWCVGFTPFAAYVVALLWKGSRVFKVGAAACLAVLIAAGALDVWRTASGQMRYEVFDEDAVGIAKAIRERTKPSAMFLNAPTYNTAIVLTGRRSLMRYTGHLSSHGIDYLPRENDVKRIYAGEATADLLLKKHGIEFVLISPLERKDLQVNDDYFAKFPLFAESGDYKVYRVTE
ncbi:MAG: hypothetical protein HKN33_02320 [Pyrinomonadaceae bacterium]|nr:hypothetical protein [Pyrinomonadaceae bacterium]